MRSLALPLCLICMFCLTLSMVRAEPKPAPQKNPEVQARILLLLAKAKATSATTCDCSGDASLCTCGPNCQCPGCAASKKQPQSPGPIEWALYMVQYQKALRANKPLLIWVGETCPICEQQWSDYVHARLSEYDMETGPEVIISKPDGLGGMDLLGRLPGIPKLEAVNNLLSPTVQYKATYQPTFFMQPMSTMMPMMGGFGGGMIGGGGGC